MAEKDRCFIFFPVGIRVSSMIKSNAYLLSVFDFSAAFMSIGRLSICVQLATYISEDPFCTSSQLIFKELHPLFI